MNNNTYVMELKTIYDNIREKPEIVFRVLSCVVYSLLENYVCIDYLSCQPKILSSISSKPNIEDTCSNI